MSDTQLLITFKKLLMSFCDELIIQFPNETDFAMLKLFLNSQIPIKAAMELFVKHINKDDGKLRKMISSRNEDFFINENPFGFLGTGRIDKLSSLWQHESVDGDDKDVIWQWVDSFVKIGDKYSEVV